MIVPSSGLRAAAPQFRGRLAHRRFNERLRSRSRAHRRNAQRRHQRTEGHTPARWTAPYVYELLKGDEHAGPVTRDAADLAGRALLAECISSVSHLYDDPPGKLPGHIPNPEVDQYDWTDFGKLLTVVKALCAIDGYESQSCEHPAWWESGANSFCHRFRKAPIAACRVMKTLSGTGPPSRR